MTGKFYKAADVIDVYMEVSINDDEVIYWVDISKLDDKIDTYDYAIDIALSYHNSHKAEIASSENAVAGEPFSRYEREFILVR